MEILGIGPLEFALIALLALILLGPKALIQTGRKLGDGLRKLVKSDTWRTITQASRQIRNMPDQLMRDAGLDEIKKAAEITQASVKTDDFFETWTPLVNKPKESPPSTDATIASPEKDRPD